MWTLMLVAQFFEKPAVDFWGTRKTAEASPAWVEPGHTPPAPVVRLMEEPTRENAEAYLKWQEDRLAKLRAALKALEEARPHEREVLYFTQDGCPWCARQDAELAKADLGGRTLRRIRPGEAPELWAKHKVEATPTLVVDGRARPGFQSRGQIEKETKP